MLVWNQYDFIECLGVLPKVDEDDLCHVFEVAKDGLNLVLRVYQYHSDIYIDLYKDGIEMSVLYVNLMNCPGARHVKERSGSEYLEFAMPKPTDLRYDGESFIPMGIRVAVDPQIRIEFFQ